MGRSEELLQVKRAELDRRERSEATRLADSTRAAAKRYDEQMARIARDREALALRSHEPAVLVNMQTWRYFHSADYPCGRVTGSGRSVSNFMTMFYSEAVEKQFEPCTACGYRARMDAARAAGEDAANAS